MMSRGWVARRAHLWLGIQDNHRGRCPRTPEPPHPARWGGTGSEARPLVGCRLLTVLTAMKRRSHRVVRGSSSPRPPHEGPRRYPGSSHSVVPVLSWLVGWDVQSSLPFVWPWWYLPPGPASILGGGAGVVKHGHYDGSTSMRKSLRLKPRAKVVLVFTDIRATNSAPGSPEGRVVVRVLSGSPVAE